MPSLSSQWRLLGGLLEGFFWISFQQLALLSSLSSCQLIQKKAFQECVKPALYQAYTSSKIWFVFNPDFIYPKIYASDFSSFMDIYIKNETKYLFTSQCGWQRTYKKLFLGLFYCGGTRFYCSSCLLTRLKSVTLTLRQWWSLEAKMPLDAATHQILHEDFESRGMFFHTG